MEKAAGKVIKGLTAISVGRLLFHQSVSSISCSPEALGPKFLCLLQHMVAEACHKKLIIFRAGSCSVVGCGQLRQWEWSGGQGGAPRNVLLPATGGDPGTLH